MTCPKCDYMPSIKHAHGECLDDDWMSWDLSPPDGWEIDDDLTYLTDGGVLIIRFQKKVKL